MATKPRKTAAKKAAAPKPDEAKQPADTTPVVPPVADPDAHPNAAEQHAAAAQQAADAAKQAEQDERDAQAAAAEAAQKAAEEAAKSADAAKERSSGPAPEVGTAAWRRGDDLRALEEERDALKAAGKDDRVKEVEKRIKQLKDSPIGRSAPKRDKA